MFRVGARYQYPSHPLICGEHKLNFPNYSIKITFSLFQAKEEVFPLRSWILFFFHLEYNKLAFYYFRDAGRRLEMPGLETVDFVIPSSASIKTIKFALFPLNTKSHVMERVQMDSYTYSRSHYRRGTQSLGNPLFL